MNAARNAWRAKRLSVTLNRRHRLTLTVRRFRRAQRAARPAARQSRQRRELLLNVRVGRVRQLSFQYRRLGRRPAGRTLQRRQHYQALAATLLILLGLGGVTYNVAALATPKDLQPVHRYSTAALPAPTPVTLPRSTPTRITIASQNINTGLQTVGLNRDGSIELPPILQPIAGWYKYSPTPGELGPAVIVGHVDNYQTISVFWRLRYVQAGDVITITRADGRIAHFKIYQLANYDQASFPTQKVYGNTTDAELRVITCGGTFDSATGHYTQNTVVYASLVS